MKYLITSLFILSLYGCAGVSVKDSPKENEKNKQSVTEVQSDDIIQCAGNLELPTELADKFEPLEDAALLKESIGKPEKGSLCQGKVYQTKENTHITVYRAWNSSKSYTKMGKWWAFNIPQGKVSKYRKDYEICFEWSPLDQLVRCTLKADAKVVIGTGQSAECLAEVIYPVSAKRQIYINDATNLVADCTTYERAFAWSDSPITTDQEISNGE